MKIAILLLVALTYLWAFWGLFVLIMGLYRAQLNRSLTVPIKLLGAPYLVAGYLCDLVCNLTLATLVFIEWPREMLVTTRLSRHISDGAGWRKSLARWICQHLLDPLDPRGRHCGQP